MLAGKKLTDFTNFFSPHDLKKWHYSFDLFQRWVNLMKQTWHIKRNFWKIENSFNSEINQRKLFSKKLSKYVAALNYIDKI